MSKPKDPREEAEKAKKKPGGQQHQTRRARLTTITRSAIRETRKVAAEANRD